MKITSLYPLYTTNDIDSSLIRWSRIGFQERHVIETPDYTVHVLKNEAGEKIDMVYADFAYEESFFAIRMNVDNFDEGKDFLLSSGYAEDSSLFTCSFAKFKVFKHIQNGTKVILIEHIK